MLTDVRISTHCTQQRVMYIKYTLLSLDKQHVSLALDTREVIGRTTQDYMVLHTVEVSLRTQHFAMQL